MSKLLTTTALCMALGLGAAAAQTTQPSPPSTTETPGATQAPSDDRFVGKQSMNDVSADELIGATVYDAQNRQIGEVNDLIMDSEGKVSAAVIGVGGFLGIGEKDVAVKFSELQPRSEDSGDDMRVTLNVTKEQLQGAPEYAYMREQRRQGDPATGSVPRRDNMPMTPPAPNPNRTPQ